MLGLHSGSQKQHLCKKTFLQCSQQSSHLGTDCPIMIVMGKADAEYTSSVLALEIYTSRWYCEYCTICETI
jgi:hypothetical protein